MKSFILLSFLSQLAFAETWDRANDPRNFNWVSKQPITTDFDLMPFAAKVTDSRIGWSETYWPSNLGGIAYRWASESPKPFKEKLYSYEELKKFSLDEMSKLSPAELYDISKGDYNYTLTKKTLGLFSPKDLWWEGICHGWSLAAVNYPEPAPVQVINKDGLVVPFGSSDVKGLLAMHDAFNSQGDYARVGKKCKAYGKVAGEAWPQDGNVPPPSKKDAEDDNCRDVNAGSFHVVITNMIGINDQAFVADIDRFNDVWNQPVIAYESTIIGELTPSISQKKDGVTKLIQIQTIMTYADELEFKTEELLKEGKISFVSKEPVTPTIFQNVNTKTYEYIIELNRENKIIGGTWLTESRPDMIWSKKKDPVFRDGKLPLKDLIHIYRPI